MDRNQVIGFLLIGLMFIVYIQFFTDPPVEDPNDPAGKELAIDSLNNKTDKETLASSEISQVVDSTVISEDTTNVNEKLQALYGTFAPLMEGKEQKYTLENEKLRLVFSSKGGIIKNVKIKNFETYSGDEVILLDEFSSKISLKFKDSFGREIDLHNLYYEGNSSGSMVSFTGLTSDNQEITITYELSDGYTLNFKINAPGLGGEISSETLTYQWNNRLKHQEHDIEVSRTNATVKYYTASGEFDRIAERTMDFEEETLEQPVKWISAKQKFFTSAIIAENPFSRAKVSSNVDPVDDKTVKLINITAAMPKTALTENTGYTYFFGPNDYHLLGEVAEEFNENVYMGWPPVSWVNKFVILPLFDLLEGFIGNYGIIIIIMVLLIKLVLSPLSYKSYLSMAKMKVLKPELDAIKEKHDGDMTKAQQDQMKLYQQVGVNPISGCVPLLLQMPILLALFYFFPQSVHLRGEGFLWADDLSTYDSIATLPFSIPGYGDHVSLFVLLMTASTILYTWSNNQVSSVQGPMKSFSYFMPLIFMFVLNSFPAALSFYYFISNLVTFGQQALIKKFVDEDKIKAILEENRKKRANKKKSKFQIKLEEAMKANEKGKKKK